MTRINCVPVHELTDKHLIAEYRELPRVAPLAYNAYFKQTKIKPLPTEYCLGTGHVRFFYDKGLWLFKRHKQLVEEMLNRGFTVNFPNYPLALHPLVWQKDWTPTQEDMVINRQRIKERLLNMMKKS